MSNSLKINIFRLKYRSKLVIFSILFLNILLLQVSCFSNPKDNTESETYLANIVDADGSLKRVMESKILKIVESGY